VTPPAFWYNPGSKATIKAAANPGYSFAGFTGDISGSSDTQSLTVNEPLTAIAHFICNGQACPAK
jgi:hypothetical protein